MEQTNRTILFEELNPDRENLFTILETAKDQESLTDDNICEIERLFLVSSFEELLEKFKPKIYLTMDIKSYAYAFSYEKPAVVGKVSVPIRMDLQNRLLTLFKGMLDYKMTGKIPGQRMEFLGNYIFPEDDFERIRGIRRRIKQAFIDKDPVRASNLLEQSQELWCNPLLQIQFFMNEAQECLKAERKQNSFIRLEETPQMQIHILDRSVGVEKKDPVMTNEDANAFFEWVESCVTTFGWSICEAAKKNLMSSAEYAKRNQRQYLELYKQMMGLYANIVRDYWSAAQPVVQTLMGIHSFFAQRQNVNSETKPALLITNCTMEQMVDSGRMRLLETFLETVNQKNIHTYTIWYAIIPRLENSAIRNRKNIRERFSGSDEEKIQTVNAIDASKTVMSILARYKIQMFLSTAASEENTFVTFSKEGMIGFYDDFRPFEKENYTEYLIPCYPNFRLMVKEQSKVRIGMQYVADELKDGEVYATGLKNIWLTGVYVDAAYVAAGLMAACQCTEYLNELYKGAVDRELPGVAYRLLEGDNRYRSKTVMAKEVYGYTEELMQQITTQANGMIFATEKCGVTVLSDKTMAFQSGNKISVSQLQTMTYLERVIRAMTQDYKDTLIKKFFVNRQDNMIHKWLQNRTMINSLFRDGESIQYQINEQEGTCNFEVRFTDSVIESRVRLSR